MERKSTIRVVELKTPHPRQFERMFLIDGALLREEADYLAVLKQAMLNELCEDIQADPRLFGEPVHVAG